MLTCEACGAANPPGSQFCTQCNAFLAWDGSAGSAPASPSGSSGTAPPAPYGGAAAPVGPGPRPGPTATTTVPDLRAQDPTVPQPQLGPDGYPLGSGPVGETCPYCGQVNDPGRRFCAHCGFGFAASIPVQPSSPSATWGRSPAEEDRAARREYRRSLPPLYRWRRVLIGLLVAVLVLAGAVWVRHPVVAARNTWYRLNKTYVKVAPITAAAEPGALTVAGADPAFLVDGSDREWTQGWQPTGTTTCGAAPGTAEIVLSFAPTRIQRLQVRPGLALSNPQRATQPLPQTIGVTYPDGQCRSFPLAAGDKQQPIRFDSEVPVTSVRIGIQSVSAPTGAGGAVPQVSITEIILQAYPR